MLSGVRETEPELQHTNILTRAVRFRPSSRRRLHGHRRAGRRGCAGPIIKSTLVSRQALHGVREVTHECHNDQFRRRLVLLSQPGDVLEGSLRDPLNTLGRTITTVQEEQNRNGP